MRQRMLWLINGGVAVVTAVLIFARFTRLPQIQNLPGSAAP